jgi:uncharacterized protein YciI
MFVVSLNYIKSINEVEHFLEEHCAYLKKYYASGNFLMSGRKEPRTGGVILVAAQSRDEVEQIIREDPFHREQLASFDVIEFVPTMTATDLDRYKLS